MHIPTLFHARPAARQVAKPLPNSIGLAGAIAGLGGRPITRRSLHRLFRQALNGGWEGPHFLDLNMSVVGGEIERMRETRRCGPMAENILRELAQRSALSRAS